MNIYISYAQGDKDFAYLLASQLRCQLDCSIFYLGMSAGDSSTEENCPESVDEIVILLSGESSASTWCQKMSEKELRDIEDCGTAVIMVMIEDCEIPAFARRENIADFRGATAEDTSSIAEHIVWASTWRKTISEHYRQKLLSGKSPEDCKAQAIIRPARSRLERHDLFNLLCFNERTMSAIKEQGTGSAHSHC